ncbi:MAG TPA: transglycosylase SLT domain-containing protein, partial [Candidatus Binataceae bacterium]|nr:transglycosylase SLT domain-containing protein [Candidatus Binataceae bacterium]
DLATAIDRLGYASDHFPRLGDYALYFCALAERDAGDLAASSGNLEKLIRSYPESATIPEAEVALSEVYLRLTRAHEAAAAASRAITRTTDAKTEQAARLALARAEAASGDPRSSYRELMTLRENFPHGLHDAEARSFAYSIVASNPEVANVNSLAYHRAEAVLLLKEGQSSLALNEIRTGLAMSPPPVLRAEFIFMKAQASKSQPEQAEAAYSQYLRIAPTGPSAPAATEALALIYWHREDRDRARAMFTKLIARFPQSHLAPGAMLRIGRIYEEDQKYDAARGEYARLIARYPSSESAEDARFRLPWSYYMTHRYVEAAGSFAAMRAHPGTEPGARDMFTYWEARAREKSGDSARARALYEQCAAGIDSNYYPELARRRVGAELPDLPAASASDPRFDPNFAAPAGSAAFHVDRVLALRELGLKDLESGELKQLENQGASDPELRNFVLAGFQSAGAYYDAIVAASRMEKVGALSHPAAERIRYPRAYWDLIAMKTNGGGLDPYLVVSLMRQESWFNPDATSSSDARGLMQLLPTTASRMVRENGLAIAQPVDLYDPDTNVRLGTVYLKQLLAMFNGDEIRAVAAYNAGEHAVMGWNEKFPGADDEWVENIGYHETREYVKRVIGNQREYRMLYGGAAMTAAR